MNARRIALHLSLATAATAALALPAAQAAPTTRPAPALGRWSGTYSDQGVQRTVTFQVAKRKGRYVIRHFKAQLKETCVSQANDQPPTELMVDVAVPTMTISTKGRFKGERDESTVTGRVRSRRSITGTLYREEDGLTCGIASPSFTAAPA